MFWVGSFYEISDQPKTGFGLGIKNIEIFLFEKREGFLVYFKWEEGKQATRLSTFPCDCDLNTPPPNGFVFAYKITTAKEIQLYPEYGWARVSELPSLSH